MRHIVLIFYKFNKDNWIGRRILYLSNLKALTSGNTFSLEYGLMAKQVATFSGCSIHNLCLMSWSVRLVLKARKDSSSSAYKEWWNMRLIAAQSPQPHFNLTISTTLCILSRSEKYWIVSGSSRKMWFTAVVAWHPWAITDPNGHFRNFVRSPRRILRKNCVFKIRLSCFKGRYLWRRGVTHIFYSNQTVRKNTQILLMYCLTYHGQ